MRRLLIGDKKLRVRDEGGSKRAPVVFIHGAAASSVTWMDVVRRLSPQRRVIAPDLPGHGQSDPWHEVSIDGYRDAVGTVCAHLAIDKVVLVGHSMGGAIALRCALAWPERVAGLVLVCSGARMRVGPAVLAAFADPTADHAALLAAACYAPSAPRDLVERWRAVAVQCPPEIALADFQAVHGFDVRDALSSIKAPALAIGGSDDVMLPPKLTLEAASGLPNARAMIVPHAAHMVHHEQPDAFHAALEAFLVEVP